MYYVFYFNRLIDRIIKIHNLRKDYYLFNLYNFCIENCITFDKILEYRFSEEITRVIDEEIIRKIIKIK